MTDNVDPLATAQPTNPAPSAAVTPAPAADPAAVTPPAAAEPPAAVLDTADPAAPAAPQNWPDNWRDLLAGDDEGGKKQLERMSSPSDVMKAYRELVKKQGSGQLINKLPDNPTPEQLAEFRKANGIPETPDKYDLTLSDGLVIGEADKPLVDGFVKQMHDMNASPQMVKNALQFYFAEQTKQIEQVATQDSENRVKATQALQAEWGGEFKQNVDMAKNLLVGQFGADTAGALFFARMPDGTIFGNNPSVLKGLVALAKEVNPAATLVPAGGNQVAAIGDEISKYETMLRDNPQEYYRDSKHQERFAQLMSARDALKARG